MADSRARTILKRARAAFATIDGTGDFRNDLGGLEGVVYSAYIDPPPQTPMVYLTEFTEVSTRSGRPGGTGIPLGSSAKTWSLHFVGVVSADTGTGAPLHQQPMEFACDLLADLELAFDLDPELAGVSPTKAIEHYDFTNVSVFASEGLLTPGYGLVEGDITMTHVQKRGVSS